MAIKFRQQVERVAHIDLVINEIMKRGYVVRMDFDAVDSRLPLVVVFIVLPKFEVLTCKDSVLAESDANVQYTGGPGLDNQSDDRIQLVEVAGRQNILPLTG